MMIAPTTRADTVDSVEFYNAATKHYFRTEAATEAAGIDASMPASGWVRTGQNYKVWRTIADAPAGAVPVCRFYSAGYNSHFYTASTGECNLLRNNEARDRAAQPPGTYIGWQYEGIVSYVMFPVARKCPAGTQPIYRSFNMRADSNHRFSPALPLFQDMTDLGWYPEGVEMCTPGTSTADLSDAYRLARQATFGPTDALVADIQTRGIAGWVDYQLNGGPAPSSYPNLPFVAFTQPATCINDTTKPPLDPAHNCQRDNYTLFPVQLAFLQNALNGQDQLRQRVAFALGQILVTSGAEIYHAYGMTRYQQLFLDNAFGNYKTLLTATTLSPAMGRYLDGRVSAVLGTHTHVQTADDGVFPGGTAYVTDVGMCGPVNSVIGVKTEAVVRRVLTQMPTRFDVGDGPVVVQGALLEIEESSGRALSIRRLQQTVEG